MVKAQTTKEQADIAKRDGLALFAFSCKSGGTISVDGPIPHEIAQPLIRLMGMVVADTMPADELRRFVDRMQAMEGDRC